MTRLVTPIFDHAYPINFDQPLTVINLHEHAKNQFIPFVHSSDRVNFRVPSHMTGHIHFGPHQPEHFERPFNLHEFIPACKKSVNS